MQKNQKLLLLGWILMAPLFTLQAQDGHSLKLGYMASHLTHPIHYLSVGYEGEIAPRLSLAPSFGLGFRRGGIWKGINVYNQTIFLPLRYYPWYSQPKLKAGPFLSTHFQYDYEHIRTDNAMVRTQYIGWGLGVGWKAGIGRFSLESFFNFSVLGKGYYTFVEIWNESATYRDSLFPAFNYEAGVMIGFRL